MSENVTTRWPYPLSHNFRVARRYEGWISVLLPLAAFLALSIVADPPTMTPAWLMRSQLLGSATTFAVAYLCHRRAMEYRLRQAVERDSKSANVGTSISTLVSRIEADRS